MKSAWEDFSHFFITLRGNNLEKISHIQVWNHRGVSYHINSRWKLRCSRVWEFAIPYSNDIILKTKLFLKFLFHLWNLHKIVNIFRKRNIVIANVFPKLQTVKDLFRQLSKKSRFRTSFATTQVKGSQTLVKSTWEHFYYTFSSIWGKVIWKKWKVIWILNQILKIFQKKEIVIANVFPELQTVKGLGRPLSKKRRFRISFDSQNVKGSRRFLKFAWEHFYHIL